MVTIRGLLGVLGSACALFFLSLWMVSWVNPILIEKTAQAMIRVQVEKRVQERIDALDTPFLTGKAQRLIGQYDEEVARVRNALSERLPERIAAVITEMQNADCECRKKIEENLSGILQGQIAHANQFKERLQTLIRSQYMNTAEKLMREFRIFTGINALVFVLFVGVLVFKQRTTVHLLPTAFVLFAASGVTGYFYLFQQNWFHTILFNDYVGLGYAVYLALVLAFLSDIIFNRGRVTTRGINACLDAVGGATLVLPC